jgi:hypothetical protein
MVILKLGDKDTKKLTVVSMVEKMRIWGNIFFIFSDY